MFKSMSILFLFMMILFPSIEAQTPVARCNRYVPVNAQCGGLYFCWERMTMCRNTLAPWTDTCCVRGARCTRRTSTEWRCTRTTPIVPAPKPSPKPAPKPVPSPARPTSFSSVMVTLHNRYRVRHQVDPIVWDSTLASDAQRWANGCVFMHDMSQRGGENLYMAFYTQTPVSAATDASNIWYNEISQYNYNMGMFSSATGHATCMLWKAVLRFGCAYQYCPGNRTYVVCRYSPACNVIGQFRQNVFPPK